MTSFSDLGLAPQLLSALAREGYEAPTPIQTQAIPHVLAGRDLLGIAQTGTGKTAAFALPMLQRLAAEKRRAQPGTVRALILSPTRELSSQIAESFRAYGRDLTISVGVVFGGQGHGPQTTMLRRGLDVLVATPGRLLDHMNAGTLRLNETSIFVLDEADQMLDMGFIRDIRKVVKALPGERQTLFFSATMPTEIAGLAGELLNDPVKVAVAPVATTAERVDQHVIFVNAHEKNAAIVRLLSDPDFTRTLVFTRTKHGADKVVRVLEAGGIEAAAIHGNKSQSQRERALAGFKDGSTRVLVATDIAARGIDVEAVSHVVNYHLPNVPEQYVHRIGRTARAGAGGVAISFCDGEERAYLRDIEKLTRQTIPASDARGTLGVAPRAEQDGERPRPSQEHRRHGPQRPAKAKPNGARRPRGRGKPARARG